MEKDNVYKVYKDYKYCPFCGWYIGCVREHKCCNKDVVIVRESK